MVMKTKTGLIKKHGEMWARNDENIEAIPGSKQGGLGVYVLYDGSTPVYIGMGKIHQRILSARKSNRRGQMWDHFSWYIPSKGVSMRDIEALFLRMLPVYLRILNRQRGNLNADKVHQVKKEADPINRAKLLPS